MYVLPVIPLSESLNGRVETRSSRVGCCSVRLSIRSLSLTNSDGRGSSPAPQAGTQQPGRQARHSRRHIYGPGSTIQAIQRTQRISSNEHFMPHIQQYTNRV